MSKRSELIHGAVDKALEQLVRVEGEMGKAKIMVRLRVLYREARDDKPAWAEAETTAVVHLWGRCEDKPEPSIQYVVKRTDGKVLRHVLDK